MDLRVVKNKNFNLILKKASSGSLGTDFYGLISFSLVE